MDLDNIVRSTLGSSDIKKENRSGDHPTVTITRNLGCVFKYLSFFLFVKRY